MRIRLVIVGIFSLVVIAGALVSATLGKSIAGDAPTQVPAIEVSTTQVSTITPLANAEDIPLYPDAQKVNHDRIWGQEWKDTYYEADAPTDKLLAFYKDQLTRRGWIYNWESTALAGSDEFNFTWVDPQGTSPYNLMLNIYLTHDNRTVVRTSLYRIPDINWIPLSPNATQLHVDANNSNTHNITYIALATPDEVMNYYKTTLVQYGWLLGPDNSAPVPGDLIFRWSLGDVDTGMLSAYVTVGTKLVGTQMTQVHIEVNGHTNQP